MDSPRPGVPDCYTLAGAAAVLKTRKEGLRAHVAAGRLKAKKVKRPNGAVGFYWRIERAALLRFVKKYWVKQRAVRLLVQPPAGRVMAVTDDGPALAKLAKIDAMVVSDLFGLGVALGETPAFAVVIDFDYVGREWAYRAAERMARGGDHPVLIGLTGPDEHLRPKKPRGLFDVLMPRDVAGAKIKVCLERLLADAAPRKFPDRSRRKKR